MRHAYLAALCILAGSVQGQQPLLYVIDTQNLGSDRFGLTIGIEFTDPNIATAYFALEAAGTSGSQIIQQLAQGGTSVNLVSQAIAQDGISGYDRDFDSWWNVGPGTAWPTPAPPYNGVDLNSGLPGSNLYQASYGAHLLTGAGNRILYLAVQGSDGMASARLNGVISRLGRDYTYDQTFVVPEPGSMLLALLGGLGLLAMGARLRKRMA